MAYQAEYIWIDGHKPTPMLRSKTKILKDSVKTPPIWASTVRPPNKQRVMHPTACCNQYSLAQTHFVAAKTFWCYAKYYSHRQASHTQLTLAPHVQMRQRNIPRIK